MKRYESKVALVSGGLGEIGLAIVRRLEAEGGRVVLGDIVTAEGRAGAEGSGAGSQPAVTALDVTNPESWNKVIGEVVETFGRLDLLVNNAGITSPVYTAIDEVTAEEWRRLAAVNVDGVFFGIQAALRAMKRTVDGGAIVNIGSISSYIGIDHNDVYATCKSAVRGMTRQAAFSAARLGHNVRINIVHPGYVWTPLVSRKLVQRYGTEEKARDFLRGLNPLGRIVEACDVASAVAFLGSDDARMITGAELLVDAGHVLQ